MSLLSSFDSPITAVLIGASGGIGQAVLAQLLDEPRVSRGIRFRSPDSRATETTGGTQSGSAQPAPHRLESGRLHHRLVPNSSRT